MALTGWTMDQVRAVAPCNGNEYRLRRAHGVTEAIADRLAVAAGYHPFEVWPEMLEDAAAERRCDRCGGGFVPVRRAQRWCSPRCRVFNAQAAHLRRRRRNDPAWAEQQRQRSRRYYRETADYQRAQARARYRQKREEAA